MGNVHIYLTDANDDMLPLVDETSITEAHQKVKTGALQIFVQGNSPNLCGCGGVIFQRLVNHYYIGVFFRRM